MNTDSNATDLIDAFPPHLKSHVRSVISIMPPATHPRSPDDIGPITVDGRPMRIPARIYHPEPAPSGVESLAPLERSILACLYTRHHDGHVRQRALESAIDIDEVWAAPFVLQMLGEYVLELIQIVADAVKSRRRDEYLQFLRENPAFLELITQRATSYWNEYFRTMFRNREDHPALSAIKTLREYLAHERRGSTEV